LTVRVPCESVVPAFGDTLSQLPPLIAVVATKVVPGIVLASMIVCPAGRLVGDALKVSDVGATLSVDTGEAPTPTLPPPVGMVRVVGVARVTVKVRITGGAAAKLALPACVAVIEQVPGATAVAMLPETVHTAAVVEAKPTASLELAFAPSCTVAPEAILLGGANVMVWVARVTGKVWITGVAGA
jgi:hypothetical protein